MQMGITDQIRQAAQKQNRLAALVGLVLGGFVPLATFTLAHYEAGTESDRAIVALGLVISGLVYSATTVFTWARIAFRHLPKALGFVVLLEGTMTLASSAWLAWSALAILTVINALATACNLAADQREHRKAERAARAPLKLTGTVARRAVSNVVGPIVRPPSVRAVKTKTTTKRKAVSK